jgi:cytosine/adenosine deaminase-related metal-dependent hydrolase
MSRATLYRASWVLPVTRPPIADGAVLVEDGRITAVGPAVTLTASDDVERVDLGDAALLPGLVNVHGHPELTGMRGLLEDLPFHEWIPTLRRVRDAAGADAEDTDAAARWTCVEALAAGVTTLAATEDSGAALDALVAAGMRGVVFREVFGPAPEAADRALQGLRDRVEEMRLRETDLVRAGISPHAPYSVSDALFRQAARYAAAESLPLAVHAAESADEGALVTAGAGPFAEMLGRRGIDTTTRSRSTIALLDATGILATRPLLIHCVHTDADDISRIADNGAAVAHCPVANARLGHGIAPVMEMLDAGVTVGLGTDSVASNNRMDLLEEARTAQLMQRARLRAPAALPPHRLLELATLDGARALRLDHRIGALQPGLDADLCAVSFRGAHVRPVIDPVTALFMSARASDVILTVVQGRVLYRAGRHLTLDPDALRPRVDAAGRRLRVARDQSQREVGRA